MKRYRKALVGLVVSAMAVVVLCLPVLASHVTGDGRHTIMGSNSVSIGQMINFFQESASYPSYYAKSDAPTIYDFCKMYYDECNAEGVDVVVAFSQAMLETGFLRFGGSASISQYNFAGIGTRADNPGESYSSVREGIRAHVQRLKIYASNASLSQYTQPLAKGIADAYSSLSWLRGQRCYVEDLNTWGGSNSYYQAVLNAMAKLEATSSFTTWYEGVNYAAVYDPYYYIEVNGDVKAAYGNNGDAVIRHFVIYGMNEARFSSRYFDVASYKRQYVDLRQAYGNDWKSYYMHYVKWGQREGRQASGCTSLQGYITVYNGVDYAPIYDYNYYVNVNGDIKAAYGEDDIAVLKHFVNYGMNEGRIASESFNVYSYRLQYGDLRQAYGNNKKSYYMHYINYGKREGRISTGCTSLQDCVTRYNGVDYSSVYDYNYYVNNNLDIKAYYGEDDVAVLKHFVNYGMNEGRIASANFDVNSYRLQYVDLRQAYGNNKKSYYMHYINYGRREGRVATGCTTLQGGITYMNGVDYSPLYDFRYYLLNNPDVANAYRDDEIAVLNHFVNYGMNEGRLAKATFNVYNYRARYGDLQTAYGNDIRSYYMHYIKYGLSEGRDAS